jgi:hypothetical protein
VGRQEAESKIGWRQGQNTPKDFSLVTYFLLLKFPETFKIAPPAREQAFNT